MQNPGLGLSWHLAIHDLELEVTSPFVVEVEAGVRVKADLWLKSFGARQGMLVFGDDADIWPIREKIIGAGYGFSVMEVNSDTEEYDREAFQEMLLEWGWTGPEGNKPVWMRD